VALAQAPTEVPSRVRPAANPAPAAPTVTQMAVPVSPAPGVARTDVDSPSARPQPTSGPSVNQRDERYEIRRGTGLGVFAPQFGPRRASDGGLQKEL
jgi:hypothetical protein